MCVSGLDSGQAILYFIFERVEKYALHLERRRFAYGSYFRSVKKLKRTPNTPTKCICINSGKTQERVLHYLISLLHSYVIYIFPNNCIYAAWHRQGAPDFESNFSALCTTRPLVVCIWKMNGLCWQTSEIPYVVVFGLRTSH